MIFADAVATWSPGPLYMALQPYVITAFGIVFSALLTWLCAILQKRTGVIINQEARETIQAAALNAAGRVMAAQDDRFAGVKVPINSPLIADEIHILSTSAKSAIDQLGLTPDKVGQLIQGKIGQLQVQAQSVVTPVVIEPGLK
jgi:hypothetical protein